MKEKYYLAKYHSIVTIKINTPFVSRNMKVIMLKDGVFKPLVDYFIENQFKSNSWQNNLTYILGLFIDYIFSFEKEYNISINKKIYFLPDFFRLLQTGTIDENTNDKSKLFWIGKKSYRVRQLQLYLLNFLDWYYELNNKSIKDILGTNYFSLNSSNKIIYWRHWSNKKSLSILSHLKDNKTYIKPIYTYQKIMPVSKSLNSVKYFDNNRLFDLLFKGFNKGINKINNIRNIMIIILMHFGGLRISEVFHLFINDIVEDPNNPRNTIVKIYHPEDGLIRYVDKYSNKIIDMTRREYLLKVYNRLPRNNLTGTNHVGWKNLSLDKYGKDNYSLVYWFPSWGGELFSSLYKLYIQNSLPYNLNHPYLFISLKGKNRGNPYTINAFRDSYKKAINKIGLAYGKDYGTTPHSHRHSFGQNLADMKVDPKIIQKALHHKSALSQMIYTAPSFEKVNEVLNQKSIESTNLFENETFSSNEKIDDFIKYLDERII